VTADDDGLRLAELVAAYSLATDLGLGQPMEHVLRSWLVAARLGDGFGIDDDQRAALYYVALLAWVGCIVDTQEVAAWFGDDIAYRADSFEVDLVGLPMLTFMLRHVGAGRPAWERIRLGTRLVTTGGREVERLLVSHCLSTARLAERLGLGPDVQEPLRQVFTRWDGKGVPGGVGGDDIALPVRLFHLADIVEVFHRAGGVDAALDVARARRGRQFDPRLVDDLCARAPSVFAALDDAPDWQALVDAEPGLRSRLSDDALDDALEGLADFTDVRSAFRAGHSRGVAALASEAARAAGLPESDVRLTRRAGLLHDLGLHGIPASILDKPGSLTAGEFERVRLHSYYTERMLARPAALARLGTVAAAHHERLDGSGYHRGSGGAALGACARLVAAADVYHAMTHARPYRPALTAKAAAGELRAEARRGRLAPEAVDAVLGAAGHPRARRPRGPAGLTPREVEVLLLIARGASTRQVARALGISARTAGTHIERIYTKIGASSRPTATLFALRHGLLDPLAPVDPSGEHRTTG
jgi:HD-GYP domain-containing protein (c-di-GMP phosphodiesterase class II)